MQEQIGKVEKREREASDWGRREKPGGGVPLDGQAERGKSGAAEGQQRTGRVVAPVEGESGGAMSSFDALLMLLIFIYWLC